MVPATLSGRSENTDKWDAIILGNGDVKGRVLLAEMTVEKLASAASPEVPSNGVIFETDFAGKTFPVLKTYYGAGANISCPENAGLRVGNETELNYGYGFVALNSTGGMSAWEFNNPITTGTYEVSFDFRMHNHSKNISPYYLALANENITSVTAENQFALFDNSKLAGTVKPVSDNWYHYTVRLERTTKETAYSVAVNPVKATGEADTTSVSTYSGISANTMQWDALLLNDTGDKYILDNIKVTKISDTATLHINEIEFFDSFGSSQPGVDSEIKEIKITFSDEMNKSVLDTAVKLADADGEISATRVLSENKKEYVLTLSRYLQGDTLTLSVEKDTEGQNGTVLKEEYSKEFEIANPSVLLDIDYDGGIPIMEELDKSSGGNDPDSEEYLEDGSGNLYLTISPNYGNWGYVMKKAIPCTDRVYEVSFDFKLPSPTGNYIVALSDSSVDASGKAADVYNCFALLGVKEENGVKYFRVGGEEIATNIFDETQWHTYKLVFNPKTRAYSLTITNKASGGKTESTGIFKSGEGANTSNGMPEKQSFDAFKFVRNGAISIDNISVKECADKYIMVSVSSDKVGNIFGGNDTKTVKVGVKNLRNESLTAEVSYIVKDEKGNTVANGSIFDGQMTAREFEEYSKTLNLTKYGVYEMYIAVNVNDGEYIYTDKFDLSVINKNSTLNSKFAVNTLRPTNQAEWDAMQTIMTQAGISGMRTDLRWVEAVADTAPTFTEYYDDAQAAGIENLAILNCSSPDGTMPHKVNTDEAWTAWEDYVRAVATKYGSVIDVYEIINEPNVWTTIGEGDDNANLYFEYLKRAYPIIKEVDSDSTVAGISSSQVPQSWIKAVLNNMKSTALSTKPKYIDVVTIHPYDFADGNCPELLNSMGSSQPWSITVRDDVVSGDIKAVRDIMDARSFEDNEIWLTEMGISSTQGVASLSAQGREIAQLMATLDASGVAKTYLYCLENTQSRADEDSYNMNAEANFGLIGSRYDTVSYAAKPAYVAMAGYNSMMNGATYVEALDTNVHLFNNQGGEQTIVLWGDNTSTNITLDLGAASVEIYDKYSNKIDTMTSSSGKYSFTATAEPVFIKGSFSNPQKTTSVITASSGRIEAGVGDEKTITLSGIASGYTVETDASSGIEVIGEATSAVTFKVNGGGSLEESLEIKVYDGSGKLVYYTDAQIHIENIKMVDVEIDGVTVNFYSQIISGIPTIKIAAENTGADKEIKLMTAYYNADDVLLSVDFTPITIPERGLGEYELSLSVPGEECENVKIFAWNENQTPFCKELRFIK